VFHCTHSSNICHTGLLTACEHDQDGTGSVLILLSAYLYDVYCCCVYSENPLCGGQKNCPKHVEFYSKNKFEKLVLPVGFIVRIYLFVLLISISLHEDKNDQVKLYNFTYNY